MMLERWDPFREMRRMEDRMDRLWRGLASGGRPEGWNIPLDVLQADDAITVRASVPGVKPEDISVAVEDGVLTIKGAVSEETERKESDYLLRERRVGAFHRAVRLPDYVDAEKAESTYANGVLEVAFPKAEAKRPRTIDVKVASA
ncbi:MAG: Hsp20/alpha crystallin family protein [Chloroflexota bacterium]|nr:Hsp20/alpha crystallin family protein [Chloroflexota bacterium]